jgi:hypothetical protein
MGFSILLEVFDFPDLRQAIAWGIAWFAPLGAQAATWLGMGVELQPTEQGGDQFWGGLDAHALWHAATASITPLWYSFCKQDSTTDHPPGKAAGSPGVDRLAHTSLAELQAQVVVTARQLAELEDKQAKEVLAAHQMAAWPKHNDDNMVDDVSAR